jgi:O-antigen ligase
MRGFSRAGLMPKLIAFLIPFSMLVFQPYNSNSYGYPKLLIASLLLLIGYVIWLARKLHGEIEISLPFIILGIFTLWTLLRYSFPASPLNTHFLWPFILLLVFTKGDYTKPLMLVTLIILVYAGLQYFGSDLELYKKGIMKGFVPDHRPFSFFGNPNHLGEWLVGVIPLAISQYWFLGFLCILTVVTTGSRAAILGLVVALVFYFFRQRGLNRKIMLALLAIILVGFLVAPWAVQKLDATTSVKSRTLWWASTATMIADHPLIGVGTPQFRETYTEYQEKLVNQHPQWAKLVPISWAQGKTSVLESSHNDYLDIGAEMGLPALLLFGWVLYLLIRHSPPAWAAGLVGLGICGLFSYPLHNPGTGILFGILATQVNHSYIVELKKWLPVGVLCILALFTFLQTSRLYVAGNYLYRATSFNLFCHPDKALEQLRLASDVSGSDSGVEFQRGLAFAKLGNNKESAMHFERSLAGVSCPFTYDALFSLTGNKEWIYRKSKIYPGVR